MRITDRVTRRAWMRGCAALLAASADGRGAARVRNCETFAVSGACFVKVTAEDGAVG